MVVMNEEQQCSKWDTNESYLNINIEINFITQMIKMQECQSPPKNLLNKLKQENGFLKNLPIFKHELYRISQDVRSRVLKSSKLRTSLNVHAQSTIRRKNKKKIINKSSIALSPTKQYFSVNFRNLANLDNDINPNQNNQQKTIDNIQLISSKYSKNQPSKAKKQFDMILYQKRKLSPIKKRIHPQPKMIVICETGNFKSTFLSIEKAPFIKPISRTDQDKDLKTRKNCSLTIYNYDKFNFKSNQIVSNNNKTNLLMKSWYCAYEKQGKNKIFNPPFQRYYYKDFIWKCAYSFNIMYEGVENYTKKFKAFIDKGNNSLLIKGLIQKRKDWWTFTQHYQQANFIWTQTKITEIFDNQCGQQSIYNSSHQNCPIQPKAKAPFQKQHEKSNLKILNQHQYSHWQEYINNYNRMESTIDEKMTKRTQTFCFYNKKQNCKPLTKIDLKQVKIHNHLPNNYIISNKKALFYTMSTFYEKTNENTFQYLPLTFHIQNGMQDPQYYKFLNSYYERAKKIRKIKKNELQNKLNPQQKQQTIDQQHLLDNTAGLFQNIWIVKPGQFTNRGNGINVCLNLQQIKNILKNKKRDQNGNYKTYIVQSYIQKPFLYQKRKFDIRHYMMIISINGIIKGYWYQLGYIRTTSFQYSTKNALTEVHLTNDAVQKYLPEYGKYEKGNKISYEQFQKYLNKQHDGIYNFYRDIYPQMKKIATDSIKACSIMIDPQKKGHNFEIFGMDFMIDADFHPWLIQINNNPCLQISCPLLGQIIPSMVENAFKISLDSIIQPPTTIQQKQSCFDSKTLEENKFEMVYNSATDQQGIIKLFNGKRQLNLDYQGLEKDEDEVYDDDGPS